MLGRVGDPENMATLGCLLASLSIAPVQDSSRCLSRRRVLSRAHVSDLNFVLESSLPSPGQCKCNSKFAVNPATSRTGFSLGKKLFRGSSSWAEKALLQARFEVRCSVESSSSKVAADRQATDSSGKSSEGLSLPSLSSNVDSGQQIAGSKETGTTDPPEGSSAFPEAPILSSIVESADEDVRGFLDSVALVAPFFLWGTAMVAMKGLLPRAGPMFVASLRLIPAGFLLIGYGTLSEKKQPSSLAAWGSIALFGFVDATCFQGFLVEGLKRTSAGLGSVIIDSQPLTVAILAGLLFGETLGVVNYLGIVLGIAGLVLLEVPVEALSSIVSGGGGADPLWLSKLVAAEGGEWRMLVSAQSMAIGTLMIRWVCKYSDPFMATGWHMVLGGLPLLALSVYQQDPAVSGHIQELTVWDWSALAYTSVGGSAISYGLFFYNATKGSLTKLSALTFLTPMFAALFGFLFLSETLTPLQCLGGAITLGGVLLVNYKPKST